MGRKRELQKIMVISIRFEEELYHMIQELASLETLHTGKVVTASQLIREAASYVYTDNERLRECFRRSRNATKDRL